MILNFELQGIIVTKKYLMEDIPWLAIVSIHWNLYNDSSIIWK